MWFSKLLIKHKQSFAFVVIFVDDLAVATAVILELLKISYTG